MTRDKETLKIEFTTEELESILLSLCIARTVKQYKKIRQLFDNDGMLDVMLYLSESVSDKIEDAIRFKYLAGIIDGIDV
jgi:hypothetical protein